MQEKQKIRVLSLGWKDPLEEQMATHFSILAWKIPWTEEPGGLQSMGLQRVEHTWATEHAPPTIQIKSSINKLRMGRIWCFTYVIKITHGWQVCVNHSVMSNSLDSSSPGSPVHGILQARILEWVAIHFSTVSSQPKSPALQADSLLSEPPGKPPY